MNNFNLIHPVIFEVFSNYLALDILQSQLSHLGPSGLTIQIQQEVEFASSEYTIAFRKAEKILKDPKIIQKQMEIFASSIGVA